MNTLQTSLLAMAVGYCLLCALKLPKLLPGLRLRFFSCYLLLEMAKFLFEWLLFHPSSSFKALWLGGQMLMTLAAAPCLWMAAMELTQHRVSIRHIAPLHRTLLTIGGLSVLPLLLSAHGGLVLANISNPAPPLWSLFVHSSMLVCIGVFVFQTPIFLTLTHRLLRTCAATGELNSDIPFLGMRVMKWMVWVLAIKWALIIFRTFHCFFYGPGVGGLIYFCLILEVIITGYVLSLLVGSRIPERFSLPHSTQDVGDVQDDQAPTHTTPKYAHSALDPASRQRILRKLEDVMAADGLFKTPGLSLPDISSAVSELPHYVSQTLNQELGTSFYDWVNRYRIEAAKRALLSDPEAAIIDIAEAVGFNSKSSFNAAFRRQTQMTPSAFRRAHRITSCPRA